MVLRYLGIDPPDGMVDTYRTHTPKEKKLSNSSSPMAATDTGLIMESLMLFWWELSNLLFGEDML